MEEKTEQQGKGFGKALRLCAFVLALVLIWQIVAPSILELAEAASWENISQAQQTESTLPDTAQGLYDLATEAIGQENYGEALTYLDQTRQRLEGGKNAEDRQLLAQAWLMEASIYILTGDLTSAREALDGSLEAEPAQGQALLLRAQLAIEGADYPAAIADVKSYLADNPTDTDTRQTFAQLLEQAQQYGDAAAEYETLYQQDTGDESFRLNALRCLFLAGRYEEAIAGFDDYISRLPEGEADPYGGIADFLRAACLLQLEDYPAAVAGFQEAAEAGYEEAACLEQITLCQFETGDYEAVVDTGQAMFAIEGGQIAMPELAYQRIGIAAMYLEDYQNALENMDKAEALSPGLEGNAYYRGVCLLALGRNQEAARAFSDSIDQGYLSQFCYYNRGVCRVELEDYETALADMELALENEQDPELTVQAQELKEQLTAYLEHQATETTGE